MDREEFLKDLGLGGLALPTLLSLNHTSQQNSTNGFDKQKVLERILQECPIKTNLKGEIEVDNYGKKEKRVIYAYYFNRGFPDPDLKYDRVANPIATTPDSTLCEMYSFWEGDLYIQELLQRLVSEGEIKPSEVVYQGPWIKRVLRDEEIIEATRNESYKCTYEFWHSAGQFERHFNKICEAMKYNISLIDLFEENPEFYASGARAIQVLRRAKIASDNLAAEENILFRSLLGINLMNEDPTLSRVLDSVQEAYERIQTTDASQFQIFLTPKIANPI